MTPEEFNACLRTGATREQFDAEIRASLAGMGFQDLDETLRACEAFQFDHTYLDAVVAHLMAVLNDRMRVVRAEAQFWAEVADEVNQQIAELAAKFEEFRRLAVPPTVH